MTSTHLVLFSMKEQLSVKDDALSQNIASADEETNEKSNHFFAEEANNFEDMRSAENISYPLEKLEIREETKNKFLDQKSQN